jgi:hypothetical protein
MMKLSDLMKKLEKAITKYGDIEIGCYGKTYAHDAERASDLLEICALRIIAENQESLPGISLEEDDSKPNDASYFAVLFYED